jgi:hypothetical protein
MNTVDALNSPDAYLKMQKSPLLFIYTMWGLEPQRVRPEYADTLEQCRIDKDYDKMREEMFEVWIPGKMITWQQSEIVYAVERAINGRGKKKISISSGHGIGKSTILAMLILWFLFAFMDCKVPCTAPTQSQMYDVLWAEIQKWILKMPPGIKELYEYSSDYIRIAQRPDTWFARARTGRKENPEALAGLHADFMMLIVDEASGVPDPIFNASKSALTGADTLFIMISNYTRLDGYFHESQTKFAEDFQVLSFNSEESPIVDNKFVEEIIREHGKDSDEYRVRVQGKSPKADGVDDGGYLPLLMEQDLSYSSQTAFMGKKLLGIDPSGEGKDMTQWVLRDMFVARIVAREKTSNEKTIAQKTLTLMDAYGILAEDITVDNFGVGANVAQEL